MLELFPGDLIECVIKKTSYTKQSKFLLLVINLNTDEIVLSGSCSSSSMNRSHFFDAFKDNITLIQRIKNDI